MKHNNPRTPGAFGRPAAWGSALALAAAFLMGSSSAFAAAPAANAAISNQASASYLDTNGNAQVAASNVVVTTVQQVGSFALDGQSSSATTAVVNTKSGAAGAVIYAPHVLTNTGNGSDSFNISVGGSNNFTKVEIYSDTNGDGLPDSATPLCSTTSVNAGCSVPTAQTVAGNNGTLSFVVAYTIPATATGNVANYDLGVVTVSPVAASITNYGYAALNQTVKVQDNVSLTTSAAFDVTQSFSTPTNINPPSGSWPTPVNNGKRSSSASCATTWSSTLASSATCTYTTYTITYQNKGGAAGRFNLQDVIGTGAAAGLTYVSGSAIWGPNSGTALSETAGSASNTALNIDFANNSGTLVFVDNAVPVNVTRTLTFVVLVNSAATVGRTNTANTVTFNPLDAVGATATSTVGVTNSSSTLAFTVNGTYGIVLGTAASVTSSDAQDTTAGTPLTTAFDTQTVAKVAAGKPAVFTHKVYNLGNDGDSVNISVASDDFPSGTIFRFYKEDGTTELSDTNADGKVDTGTIPAGSFVTIVVKATVPTTTAANTTGYSLVLKGVSGNDSTQIDASADKLAAVTGPFVDLTNNSAAGVSASGANADLGTGPSASPTVSNASVPAGSWTTFDLWLTNNDSLTNTYALSASSTNGFPGTLPTGWTVKFVAGATTSASCSAATAITSTASVSTGANTEVTACVYVPATQVQVTQAVYFQAKANSAASDGSTPVDIIYDQVVVIAAASTYSATVTPNGAGQVAPGGSVVYAHLVQATGTGTCAAGATATVTLPAADVTAGWTYALYVDTNGNGQLDAGDTLVTGTTTLPAVVPGTPLYLLVKVFAPGGAIAGATDIATVKVDFGAVTNTCGTGTAAPTATDTTTVVTGQVRLYASQAKNSACDATGITTALGNLTANAIAAKPGECIVYQLKAVNEGTAVLTNLNLTDVVPSYTTLTTVQPTTTCTSTSVAPAFANPSGWTTTTTSISCGNGSTATTVQPGGTATLTFQVQINQ